MNFQNRTLFHSDSLHFLRGSDSDTIDMIVTRPDSFDSLIVVENSSDFADCPSCARVTRTSTD